MHNLGQKLAENIQAKNEQDALDQAALQLIECRKAVKRFFDDARSYFENAIIKGEVPNPVQMVDNPETHPLSECLGFSDWDPTWTEIPDSHDHRIEWNDLVLWATEHNLRIYLSCSRGDWFVNVAPLVI